MVNGYDMINIATFYNKEHAREAFTKAKKKSPDVILLRVTEEELF